MYSMLLTSAGRFPNQRLLSASRIDDTNPTFFFLIGVSRKWLLLSTRYPVPSICMIPRTRWISQSHCTLRPQENIIKNICKRVTALLLFICPDQSIATVRCLPPRNFVTQLCSLATGQGLQLPATSTFFHVSIPINC